ncbi:Hpt domain-containing protein [Flammeovirga sp. OC4]|uniref:Hpt domain-containing protein n=1 Tax=Flammeovirga sp. OC4 TaxID=1382345 RepID=UPI0005C515E9|nr:Hpt domain-containing protein [Flammeovirga sp. OC4]
MSTVQNTQLYNLSQLEMLSRGDQGFVDKMLNSFMGNLKDGIKEITDAYRLHDWNTIGKVAHKLKPSMLVLGVTSLKETIIYLEQNQKTENIDEKEISSKVEGFLEKCGILLMQIQQISNN